MPAVDRPGRFASTDGGPGGRARTGTSLLKLDGMEINLFSRLQLQAMFRCGLCLLMPANSLSTGSIGPIHRSHSTSRNRRSLRLTSGLGSYSRAEVLN